MKVNLGLLNVVDLVLMLLILFVLLLLCPCLLLLATLYLVVVNKCSPGVLRGVSVVVGWWVVSGVV